jgi:hypothetical protein
MQHLATQPAATVSLNPEAKGNNSGLERSELIVEYQKLRTTGFRPGNIDVREAGTKGLGVFATDSFRAGNAIEYCHAILLGFRNRYTHDPSLKQYAYWLNCSCKECKTHGVQGMIPLGFGAIYNSAESEQEANASHRMFAKERLIVFVAKRDILAGEEILTWWGQKYFDSWCKPGKTDTGEATGLVAGLA